MIEDKLQIENLLARLTIHLCYHKIPFLILVFVCVNAKASDHRVFTDTIHIEEHEGHILMPVNINHETKRLIFDTGCSVMTLWGDGGSKPFKAKWIGDATDVHNHTSFQEIGLVLTKIGSQCDSLPAAYMVLPSDSALRETFLRSGDGLMGFITLIRRGLGYYVKVDLQKGIMIVSNDHRLATNTTGVKVSYKKCDELPTFKATIGKHKIRAGLDSGAAHLCNISSNTLDKWAEADKFFNSKKVYDGISDNYVGINDTTITSRRVKAYNCDLRIKSFEIKDAIIIDNPYGINTIGVEIFKKAIVIFDPWHCKIIFQPYGNDPQIISQP